MRTTVLHTIVNAAEITLAAVKGIRDMAAKIFYCAISKYTISKAYSNPCCHLFQNSYINFL